MDTCDAVPTTAATAGVPLASGDKVTVKPRQGTIVLPGDALSVTVTAEDASGNANAETIMLPIAQ